MASPAIAPARPALASLPPRIAFFDGLCGFCDKTVRWLIDRDPNERLHFAPLQGETAELVRAAFPGEFPEDIDTLVFFDRAGESPHLLLRSRAIFEVLRVIGGRTAWLARLCILPVGLTDFLYRVFVRRRYRLFGKLDECRVPSPEERSRFLS